MISFVRGELDQVSDGTAVVDVGGVGYLVIISPSTAGRLPAKGKEVKLYTHMQATDAGVSLHGFLTREEIRMFALLISVSGIGPKAATSVLSSLSPAQIMIAVLADDSAALSRAPGVGRKTAQRIALELRDKLKGSASFPETEGVEINPAEYETSDEKRDAIEALKALGYGRAESLKAVVDSYSEGMEASEIIRQSLRKLR